VGRGRRLYHGIDWIYGGEWRGPVFVLTHRSRDEVPHDTVTFLAVPLAEALATARTAANGKNVVIFGDNLAQQCLREGILDEIDNVRGRISCGSTTGRVG
jgi:dihydrofolate reductase